jgi:hypothetical protein
MLERFLRVLRVSNQIDRPITSVKIAQTTVMYPWNFSQPLVIGMTIAGTEIRKVKKMKPELTIAAIQPLVKARFHAF